MGELFESVATLRLFGDDLIPDEVSEMLGGQPTSSSCKGGLHTFKHGGTMRAPTGSWRLETARLRPGDLDRHVDDLLSNLIDDLGVWAELSRRFRVNIFFGIFMKTHNEGLSLSPDSMRAGGLRGITFDFDLYGSEMHVSDEGIRRERSGGSG